MIPCFLLWRLKPMVMRAIGARTVTWDCRRLLVRHLIVLIFLGSIAIEPTLLVADSPGRCEARAISYEGWKAQELFNQWVHVIIVPQLGGRVMQVQFGGHDYLFVNPAYKGKYIPPVEAAKDQWINYGGDKLWPLPEGHGDAEHWPGPISDALDDGEYNFRIVRESEMCTVRLDGPADAATGLKYSRDITIGANSPEIFFHAEMKNTSDRAIRWSVQSVTQYDAAEPQNATRYNHDFWAFAPVNSQSTYMDGYHVRNGLADDPSFSIRDGLFSLHWLYLENEVWLDEDAGWIAVVDDAAKFGMVEKFQYAAGEEYPGRASVIFYKNGAALELDKDGMPQLRSADPRTSPYYLEAELNSPMVRLQPGDSYAFETTWHPVRADKNLVSVNDAGVVEKPLAAVVESKGLRLTGKYGVFLSGKLIVQVSAANGTKTTILLDAVDPLHEVELDRVIPVSSDAVRISIHLNDDQGSDLGVLDEVEIARPGKSS
jgi:hypothetical protein